MHKFLGIIVMLFPYTIAFAIYCLFNGFLIDTLFDSNAYLLLFALLVFWLIAFICAIIIYFSSLRSKYDFEESCRLNMLIKIIPIPAYLFIFGFGIIFMATIFTFGISVILWVLDMMAIILSGIIGLATIAHGKKSNALSSKQALLHRILQFIFVADVFSAISLWHKAKLLNKSY